MIFNNCILDTFDNAFIRRAAMLLKERGPVLGHSTKRESGGDRCHLGKILKNVHALLCIILHIFCIKIINISLFVSFF